MKWLLVLLLGASLGTQAKTLVVCPAAGSGCDFSGKTSIQAAVDAAVNGDVVQLKSGVYQTERFRDVPYQQYVIRGFVVVERKHIELIGEQGAVLDGASGPPVSAIVLRDAEVSIRNLTIRNFRAGEKEDDLYEGHGIFVIDSRADLRNVSIERFEKMALTGRGAASITASDLRIQDGHVAIWLEERAHLRLCNAVVRNNESAGVAAYVNASATIYNSVFDGNHDDGLYAAGNASIVATNSQLLRNKPFGVRVVDNARALIMNSVLSGNEQPTSSPQGTENVKLGDGGPSLIDLRPIASCAELHGP